MGREITLQTPSLKNVLKQGLAYDGFSFIEVISDCTEVFGRKNEMGDSAEMVLTQKASVRPDVYENTVEQPFRPNHMKTGILARNSRPEYAAAYRQHMLSQKEE